MSGETNISTSKEPSGFRPASNSTTTVTIRQLVNSSILVVIVASQIPIILYYKEKIPEPSLPRPSGIDFEICTADDESIAAATLAEFCSQFSRVEIQNKMFYNICITHSFYLLQSINLFVSLLNNEQCSNLVLPFISNGTHLLCADDKATILVGLQEKYVQIDRDDCSVEWRIPQAIFDTLLPGCQSVAIEKNVTFSCPKEFDIFCNSFCLPSCKRLSPVSWNNVIVHDIVTIAIILSLLGAVLLLLWIIEKQKNSIELSVKQQLAAHDEKVKSIHQTKMRKDNLAAAESSNAEMKVQQKEGLVTENSGLPPKRDHYLQIIQKNCEEVCDDQLQMYREMYVPQPSSKEGTMVVKIARTYDEERAYRIYISSITKWRSTTSLAFEPPKHKLTNEMEILVREIEKKVFINKSPEEEICKNAIKNCLHNRDQIISQLYKQLKTETIK